MGNPRPTQTADFRQHQYQPLGDIDVPLAKTVMGIRLPQDVDDLLRTLPKEERVVFLRRVITEATRARFGVQ